MRLVDQDDRSVGLLAPGESLHGANLHRRARSGSRMVGLHHADLSRPDPGRFEGGESLIDKAQRWNRDDDAIAFVARAASHMPGHNALTETGRGLEQRMPLASRQGSPEAVIREWAQRALRSLQLAKQAKDNVLIEAARTSVANVIAAAERAGLPSLVAYLRGAR